MKYFSIILVTLVCNSSGYAASHRCGEAHSNGVVSPAIPALENSENLDDPAAAVNRFLQRIDFKGDLPEKTFTTLVDLMRRAIAERPHSYRAEAKELPLHVYALVNKGLLSLELVPLRNSLTATIPYVVNTFVNVALGFDKLMERGIFPALALARHHQNTSYKSFLTLTREVTTYYLKDSASNFSLQFFASDHANRVVKQYGDRKGHISLGSLTRYLVLVHLATTQLNYLTAASPERLYFSFDENASKPETYPAVLDVLAKSRPPRLPTSVFRDSFVNLTPENPLPAPENLTIGRSGDKADGFLPLVPIPISDLKLSATGRSERITFSVSDVLAIAEMARKHAPTFLLMGDFYLIDANLNLLTFSDVVSRSDLASIDFISLMTYWEVRQSLGLGISMPSAHREDFARVRELIETPKATRILWRLVIEHSPSNGAGFDLAAHLDEPVNLESEDDVIVISGNVAIALVASKKRQSLPLYHRKNGREFNILKFIFNELKADPKWVRPGSPREQLISHPKLDEYAAFFAANGRDLSLDPIRENAIGVLRQLSQDIFFFDSNQDFSITSFVNPRQVVPLNDAIEELFPNYEPDVVRTLVQLNEKGSVELQRIDDEGKAWLVPLPNAMQLSTINSDWDHKTCLDILKMLRSKVSDSQITTWLTSGETAIFFANRDLSIVFTLNELLTNLPDSIVTRETRERSPKDIWQNYLRDFSTN